MEKPSIKSASKPTVSFKDVDFLPILIALGFVLFTFVILFLWKKRRSVRTDILFAGLCDSGKTYLFSQLVYSEAKLTFTSIAENIGDYKCENGVVRLVDIPGHERLRGKFFDQYKSSAKGIVYVVDSVTFQKDIRDVADFLYTILSDKATQSIPILILCNKQDETMAKGSNVVKNLLEKEINLVRTTRTSQLQSVDNSATNNVFLGKQGKDFEFSQLSQSIDVVECSAQNREYTNLCTWIESFA